jgi:hypothetical protein
MPETTKASTGAKSQFHLFDGAALYKLNQVKSFGLPSPEVEQIESTHLESDAKEFIPGDTDFGEFEVKLNLRPGSTTDLLLEDAAADQSGADLAFRGILAVRGVLTRQYDGNCNVVAYDRGEINRSGVMEATARLRATGAVTSSAYVAP